MTDRITILHFLVALLLNSVAGHCQTKAETYDYYSSSPNGFISFDVAGFKREFPCDQFPVLLMSGLRSETKVFNSIGIIRDSFADFSNTSNKRRKPYCGKITMEGTQCRLPIGDWRKYRNIYFSSCKMKDIAIVNANPIKEYHLNYCTVNTVYLEVDTINLISNSSIRELGCGKASIGKFILHDSIDKIVLWNCVFQELPEVSLTGKPGLLSLKNCKFNFNDKIWDLSKIWNWDNERKCVLNITGTDLSKLKFRYADFLLDTTGLSLEQLQSIYNSLKEQYTKFGMSESLELVDIDLIRLNNRSKGGLYKMVDWINYRWWKYGYDKGMVVANSAFLFAFFLLINLLFGLTRLLVYAYSLPFYNQILDKIDAKKNKFVKAWFRFWYIFLYTCLVFWGLNLDKKELKYENLGYLCYVIFQYIIGLICLAYLATFILSK